MMKEFDIRVNGVLRRVTAVPDKPLLWVLREDINLTGTKYGCGFGICGACTVIVDGDAVRACQISIEDCVNRAIVTIEGLSKDGTHPIQQAWMEENVSQCGYCQCGQIMSAKALLDKNPYPEKEEIEMAMSDNYCRCGTYHRIEKAIHRAVELNRD